MSENNEKQTTKVCPKCGSDELLHFTSLDKKVCPSCIGNDGESVNIPWPLEPGQKSVYG